MPRSFAWFFWISALGVALVSWRVLLAPVEWVMPAMAHYLADFPLSLAAHVFLGPLALLLAPFQLWQGLRRRRPGLHRWLGRLYALAILGGGLASLALMTGFQGSAFAASGFVALAVLWIGTTLWGIGRARAGDLAAHRRWMQRSVALTFAAVTLRLIMAPLMAAGWSVTETYEITAWGSWLINLAVLEVWQQRRSAALRRA